MRLRLMANALLIPMFFGCYYDNGPTRSIRRVLVSNKWFIYRRYGDKTFFSYSRTTLVEYFNGFFSLLISHLRDVTAGHRDYAYGDGGVIRKHIGYTTFFVPNLRLFLSHMAESGQLCRGDSIMLNKTKIKYSLQVVGIYVFRRGCTTLHLIPKKISIYCPVCQLSPRFNSFLRRKETNLGPFVRFRRVYSPKRAIIYVYRFFRYILYLLRQ